MNTLIISKKEFYKDVESILNNIHISKILGTSPEISTEFIETLKSVIEIMTDKPQKIFYQLRYPEKHFPNNASQFFWEKVRALMEIGVMFEVVTSDVCAIGWIPSSKMVEGVKTQGWDSKQVEIPEENGWNKYEVEGFGQTLEYLVTTIKF